MLGFLGWGKKKKTRVLRTEPEGIAEIRRQEMGKQSTKGRADGERQWKSQATSKGATSSPPPSSPPPIFPYKHSNGSLGLPLLMELSN